MVKGINNALTTLQTNMVGKGSTCSQTLKWKHLTQYVPLLDVHDSLNKTGFIVLQMHYKSTYWYELAVAKTKPH